MAFSMMLPAIARLLPQLPKVFRNKVHKNTCSSDDQMLASDATSHLSAKLLSCHVILLDDTEFIATVKQHSKVRALLDQVFVYIGVVEKEYFGLYCLTESKQAQWLDLNRSVGSQLSGKVFCTLYFAVKFYAADPCKLFQEITRYQFFLQLKRDISEGRLPVDNKLAAELAAYTVQSELGDFDPCCHLPGYVSEFDFIPNQTEQFERNVAELHRRLCGLVPSEAERKFLDRVKWLDMYGTELYPVQGAGGVDYYLGIAPTGLVVYHNKVKLCNHFWTRLTKVSCKGSQLVIRVRDKENVAKTYTFDCPTKMVCKLLEKNCAEHHQFFRSSAANYSYQTTIRLRTSLDNGGRGSQQTPTFVRKPSTRRKRRLSNLDNSRSVQQQSFLSLPPSSARTIRSVKHCGFDSPTSVRSEVIKRRSYVNSEIGCSTSHKRSRRNCCTATSDMNDASFSTVRRRRRASGNTAFNESECESEYSCCHNYWLRSSRRLNESSFCVGDVDTQSVAARSYMLSRFNNSMTSMASAPEPRSHRRMKHRRRHRRLPPEQLAQHFRYVDPLTVGPDNDLLQNISYTHVETDSADQDLKISPRTWQRLRQRQQKIHCRTWQQENSQHAWITPQMANVGHPLLSDHRPITRGLSARFTPHSSAPSQYLQNPIPVQVTQMHMAPIVKIRRNDGGTSTQRTILNMSSVSSTSSSATATDLYAVNQMKSAVYSETHVEHC